MNRIFGGAGAFALIGGIIVVSLWFASPGGSVEAGVVPTATPDPTATPLPCVTPGNTPTATPSPTATPDLGPLSIISALSQQAPPTCIPSSTQIPPTQRTVTPTPSPTKPAQATTAPSNTSVPATATRVGSGVGAGVQGPDTGTGPGGGARSPWLVVLGAALALVGGASLAYGARRRA